ncbi:sulfatase [Coraliomargarita parva]|uniref:sulfatase n=1 Tax=Coraliomargarita parva TaxID=3014050 RepID=UPI0022B2E462|nr:sulfatase [Coraliomargarita parva]
MRVLYIDIDSLRPDHLGCYGYHRNTSPVIDQIAREGVVFDRCYTTDAPCLPSRTAFYSGRFGIQTGVVGHGGTAAQPKVEGATRSFDDLYNQQGLARQFQKLGFHTAMVSPFGQRHAAWHFYAGFHEVHNTGDGGMESAEVVQPVVDKWMADNASKDNWFLHLNYWDPHAPYRVPDEYGNPFEGEPIPEWLEQEGLVPKHNKIVGPHTSMEVCMYHGRGNPRYPRYPGQITDDRTLRMMIDGYDVGVRYVDDHLARTIAALKDAGVYDDTMIIISADHGENLGELGIYGEHATADDATCRIPLIIKYPGGAQGVRNQMLHYNIDLAPTLMELFGGEKQPIWDGDSFAAAIEAGDDVGRDEVVFGQCAHVCQRSVRWGRWLYTKTYHDGLRLYPQEMLFDLDVDPHEENDIADENPEICREGQWRLSRWHDAQMQRMALNGGDMVDPLWTVVREGGPFHARIGNSSLGGTPLKDGFEDYMQHLEATDRQEGAIQLRQKYAAQLARC